jgi:glutamate-1-semialdehyde 2,1-aminomutase
VLKREQPYERLEALSERLSQALIEAGERKGIELKVNRIGSMLTLFFTSEQVTDYETALTSNTNLYARFFHSMLARGVYLPPSQFEAMFVSAAHTEEDIEQTIEHAVDAFSAIAS